LRYIEDHISNMLLQLCRQEKCLSSPAYTIEEVTLMPKYITNIGNHILQNWVTTWV